MAFFKRFVPLFFVFLIVVSLSVFSVSADGYGPNQMLFAVIPFDEIAFDTQYRTRVTFPGSFLVRGSMMFGGSEGGDTGYSYVSIAPAATNDPIIPQTDIGNVEITVNPSYSIRLIARDFILDKDRLDYLSMGFGQDYVSGSVEWDIKIRTIVLKETSDDSGQYEIRNSNVTGSRDLESGENFARYLLAPISVFEGRRFVYIESMELTFTTNQDVPDGFFDFQYSVAAGSPELSAWFDAYRLQHIKHKEIVIDPANPDDVSFVEWLQKAVGSFLDFELWNGFTLNQLIEFVVVIGIVLWFITLLI